VSDRLTVSASVHVRAEPGAVFAVISDLRRKAPLNPYIEVIRVELEGGEPIRPGSVFYHRLRRESRIFEYRSRCLRCEPPRLFESRGETDPSFEVTVTVEPDAAGCRVTQEERLETPAELLDALDPPPTAAPRFREVMRWLALFPAGRPLVSEVRVLQRERVARRLTRELETWLEAIRAHVEGGHSTELDPPRRPTCGRARETM